MDKHFFFLLAYLIAPAYTQRCGSFKNCSECVLSYRNCHWCIDLEYDDQNRCISSPEDSDCNNFYAKPDTTRQILDSTEINTGFYVTSPSSYKFHNVLKDVKNTANFEVRSVKSLPIELLFLVDGSSSMQWKIDIIRNSLDDIADHIRDAGSDAYYAVGLVTDTSRLPPAWDAPCEYKLLQSMTNDIESIKTALGTKLYNAFSSKDIAILSGIAQGVLCTGETGWGKFDEPVKILLLMTDSADKSYLDGYDQGKLLPFSMICQLESLCFNAAEDYPSYHQIHKLLAENEIEFIVIADDVLGDYFNALKKYFREVNTYIGSFDNSQKVVSVFQDTIIAAAKTVSVSVATPVEGVDIKFASNCKTPLKVEEDFFSCVMDEGESFTLSVSAILRKCTTEDEIEVQIQIRHVGILSIYLKPLCECQCRDALKQSSSCNSQGDLNCGICDCTPQWSGKYCDCSVSDDKCFMSNMPENQICSGKGSCNCNKCECKMIPNTEVSYYGSYCECGYKNCLHTSKGYCGGPDQGRCDCDNCVCEDYYSPPNCIERKCDHEHWIKECRKDGDDVDCSSNGKCICGTCRCDSSYTGKHCDIPYGCVSNEFCVSCYIRSLSGDASDDCNSCIRQKYTTLSEDHIPGEYACTVKIDYCYYYYDFDIIEEELSISIYSDIHKICYRPPNIAAVVSGIVGGIILIVALLISAYFLLKYHYDRMEFKKYQSLVSQRGEGVVNPLFEMDTLRR